MQPYRIGILGGMGPLAGVELHRLIIEATPAGADQDHLQVVLFTDPKIPDRTTSLREDGGTAFAAAAGQSAKLLDAAGVDIIAIGCMTAHSRLADIQQQVQVPIVDAVARTKAFIQQEHPGQPVALLATNGSIQTGIYTGPSDPPINWVIPPAHLQPRVNDALYRIKAGDVAGSTREFESIMAELRQSGAAAFVLGCTELSLIHDELVAPGVDIIDPLRVLARHLVQTAQKASPAPISP